MDPVQPKRDRLARPARRVRSSAGLATTENGRPLLPEGRNAFTVILRHA